MERRIHERYRLWFPVQMQATNLENGMGISHNTSVGGILIASAVPLEVGAKVKVTFRPKHDSPDEKSVDGRVIRLDENKEDPYGLWPHRLAVEFDALIPELEAVLMNAGEKI